VNPAARALGAALVLGPTLVCAHGSAPAALGVVGDDLARPVVRLSFGLATPIGTSGTFRYICPAVFGAQEQVPPAARLPDGRVIVAGPDAVRLGDAEGCAFEVLGVPGYAGGTPVAVAVHGGDAPSVTVATRSGEGSVLWRFDASRAGVPVFADREALPALRVDDLAEGPGGTLYALAARPVPTLLVRGGGEPEVWPIAGVDPVFHGLNFRLVDETDPGHLLFGGPTDEGEAALESFDGGRTAEVVVTASARLHGPVPLADGLMAVADGVLLRRRSVGETFVPFDGIAPTCLSARGASPLACLDRGLVRLVAEAAGGGVAVEPFFALAALDGVEPACPAEATLQAACASAWIHFGGEGGLVTFDAGLDDPDAASPLPDAGLAEPDAAVVPVARGAASGCRTAPGAADGLLLIAVALLGYHARPGHRRPRRRTPWCAFRSDGWR
jgi:hypothetical protein